VRIGNDGLQRGAQADFAGIAACCWAGPYASIMVKPPAVNIGGSLEGFFDGVRLAELFLYLASQLRLCLPPGLVVADDLSGGFP
ncbi:hypothetical protein, partial [Rhizobium sp. AN73]|uniref:hypothetical protein n=1 Tax=Rhizobium sp. AN73 TaxID=3035124 RepID=UPI00274095D5